MNQPALYESAFELFQTYIYGADAVLTADQNLVLTLLSTTCALAVVLLPFVLVWMILKFIVR